MLTDPTLRGWSVAALLSTALLAGEPTDGVFQPDPATLRTVEGHLTFLASDAMGGRETGTVHGDVTAVYIASVFRRLGLLPAGDGASYLQAYPLTRSRVLTDEGRLTVSGVEGEFAALDDFVLRGVGGGDLTLSAGLVYAGHAVVDEEAGLDELAGLDVEGRLVLARSGTPGDDAELDERVSWRTKRDAVQERGGLGLVLFGDEDDRGLRQSRRWARLGMQRTSLTLGGAGDDAETPFVRLYPESELLEALFAAAGRDLEAVLASAPGTPGFELEGVEIDLHLPVETEVLTAHNVAGLLPGGDPELADEVVVLSAHMDHIGIGSDGQVNNGADDNASGTTSLLTVAESLAGRAEPLRRSVLFLAVSGEEKGLLGSEWWVNNPTWDLDRVAADINMDMVGRNDPHAIGITPSADHADYNTMVEKAIELGPAAGLDVGWSAGDGDFERKVDVYYRRSDHANFADHGIPVVFFFAGEHEDYHRPGDTTEKIDVAKVGRVARLVELLTAAVANDDGRPQLIDAE